MIRDSDNLPLVGILASWGAYATGVWHWVLSSAPNVGLDLVLEWYPVVATTATRIAPEVGWLPTAEFETLVFAMAVIVVLYRGGNKVADTINHYRK